MSGQATGWVLRNGPHPDLTDHNGVRYGARARGLRAVLVAVGDAANQDGEHAHPGIANICIGSLYGRRQATKLLAELVIDGWLRIETEGGGAGRATVYSIPGVKAEKDALSAQLPPRNHALSDEKPRTLEQEPRTPGVRTNGLPTVKTNDTPSVASGDVRAVFDAWAESVDKPRAVLDPKRRRVIDTALHLGYSVQDLIDAVRGWRWSPHHRGENERGTVYNDLGLLLRNAENIERFRDWERGLQRPKPRPQQSARMARSDSNRDRIARGAGLSLLPHQTEVTP